MIVYINPNVVEPIIKMRDELNEVIKTIENLRKKFSESQDQLKKLGLTSEQIEGIRKILFEE